MQASTIEKVLDKIYQLWGFTKNIEITSEANPSSAEIKTFKEFKAAGINRMSIGVQSLNAESLAFLGRKHSVSEAKNAVLEASNVFAQTSLDLIYGLPNQDPLAWELELAEALKLTRGHISLYQLTVERGTDFFRNKTPEATEDLALELLNLNQKLVHFAGLHRYEISNYATHGHECQHNLLYWTGRDYIGIGPGAHSRITSGNNTYAAQNFRDPKKWLESIKKNRHGQQKSSRLSFDDRKKEIIIMGLRLTKGITHDDFKTLTGAELAEELNTSKIEALTAAGFITLNKHGLKATSAGLQRLNAVLDHLLN